jgi:carbon-monoxide dehydrogenase small subunit
MSAAEQMTVAMTLNGRPADVTVDASAVLIDVLRDQIGLRGVKRSCDMEVCGTCTVLVDGLPFSSCTTLAVDMNGRSVLTIEGLGTADALSPVQQAFVDYGALQCGFCTPGMVLAVTALLALNPNPTEAETREFLKGNLCRCTGYVKILDAVRSLAGHARSEATRAVESE